MYKHRAKRRHDVVFQLPWPRRPYISSPRGSSLNKRQFVWQFLLDGPAHCAGTVKVRTMATTVSHRVCSRSCLFASLLLSFSSPSPLFFVFDLLFRDRQESTNSLTKYESVRWGDTHTHTHTHTQRHACRKERKGEGKMWNEKGRRSGEKGRDRERR